MKLSAPIRPSLTTCKRGVTLTSVVVATALMSLVAVAVTKMFINQERAMGTLGLLEKRVTILKHYGEVVVAGWDRTKQQILTGFTTGAIAIYYRDDTMPQIPITGLYLGHDLHTAVPVADGWWKITATAQTLTGTPINSATDTLIKVTLKIIFYPNKHPSLKTKLAEQERVIFFHHNVAASNTDCDVSNVNKAIIQYDFISNFTRCSKRPLVRISQQTNCGEALLGFDPAQFTSTNKWQLHTTYGGTTLMATACGVSRYIESISACGNVTCSPPSHCTLPLPSCSTYVNTISCSSISCDPGPEGPQGPDGTLLKNHQRVDDCNSAPTTCPGGTVRYP